ncbi:MAG TPA: hypothetical protein PKY28_11085 [Ferruginibacter sp.]|nr:hypothetical protein [Ferruginibacter sp.]
MNYLLFVVYLVILSWLLLRVPFIKNAGISSRFILGLFLIKIMAGIAIGWVSIHIYGPGNDYWDVNDFAREEYQLMLTNPGRYLSNLFTSDYEGGYGGIFSSFNSYWNDLENNILIKLVSVFNIFSRGNYYINSLFFNFIIFFGHVILYRLFMLVFPVLPNPSGQGSVNRQFLVISGCFLLPSTLYFTSGIHKDGLVFLMLAVLLYSVYQSLHKKNFSVKRLILIGTAFLFLFLLRNFVFLALLPAVFAWILAERTKWNAILTFTGVYLVSGLLFFTVSFINPAIDPPAIIVNKQSDYINLPVASTQIPLTPLQPNFLSFVSNAPQALQHSFLRPYPGEQPMRSLLPFSIELLLYHILLLLLIFFRRKDAVVARNSFLVYVLFFTLTVFLFIGYIVPNLGSLVRYRSLFLPFIITPILCTVGWRRLGALLKINK